MEPRTAEYSGMCMLWLLIAFLLQGSILFQ